MGFHLALGLDHEAQVPSVAAQPGQGADRVAAGVPQGLNRLGRLSSSASRVAHRQMVGLFLGRFQQVFTRGRVAGHGGLAEIQALRADFADVVDPHQAGCMAALGAAHAGLVGLRSRVGAGRRWVAEHRVRGALRLGQQVVQRGGLAEHGHGSTRWGGSPRFSPGPASVPTRPDGPLASGWQGQYNPASCASPFHNAWQSSGEPFAAMSPT